MEFPRGFHSRPFILILKGPARTWRQNQSTMNEPFWTTGLDANITHVEKIGSGGSGDVFKVHISWL
jgi:hypothetical protein